MNITKRFVTNNHCLGSGEQLRSRGTIHETTLKARADLTKLISRFELVEDAFESFKEQ